MLQFQMPVTIAAEEGMFQTETPITELCRRLVRYDLTPNQAKVYLFLSKIGIKTASEISKSLKIHYPQIYLFFPLPSPLDFWDFLSLLLLPLSDLSLDPFSLFLSEFPFSLLVL